MGKWLANIGLALFVLGCIIIGYNVFVPQSIIYNNTVYNKFVTPNSIELSAEPPSEQDEEAPGPRQCGDCVSKQ